MGLRRDFGPLRDERRPDELINLSCSPHGLAVIDTLDKAPLELP